LKLRKAPTVGRIEAISSNHPPNQKLISPSTGWANDCEQSGKSCGSAMTETAKRPARPYSRFAL
jgi:hypothetical protein